MAPAYRTLLLFLSLLLPGLLLISSPGLTRDADEQFITILPQPAAEDTAVQWKLDQAKNGLLSLVKVSFDKPEKTHNRPENPGWEYRLESDGMIVSQESLPEETQTAEQLIAVNSMPDGDHTLVLTVRDFLGKLHTREQSFCIDASPRIHISSPEGKGALINPEITFSFFGEQDGAVGFVEVFLDDRLLIGTGIKKEQNQSPLALTDLVGSALYAADLQPGTHLLSVAASGLNGSRAVRSVTVMGSVDAPEISVQSTGDKKLKRLEVAFPLSSQKLLGGADIRYQRSIILSLRAEDTFLSIPREAIEKALTRHGIKIDESPVKMTISTYAANHIENWQEFTF